jgi:hypothetical protein
LRLCGGLGAHICQKIAIARTFRRSSSPATLG